MPVLVVFYHCELNEITYFIGVFEFTEREKMNTVIDAYCALHDVTRGGINIVHTYMNQINPACLGSSV